MKNKTEKTDYQIYLKGLTERQLKAYAKRAGTTPKTVMDKYYYKVNIPRPARMDELIKASRGCVERQAVLDHFYQAA